MCRECPEHLSRQRLKKVFWEYYIIKNFSLTIFLHLPSDSELTCVHSTCVHLYVYIRYIAWIPVGVPIEFRHQAIVWTKIFNEMSIRIAKVFIKDALNMSFGKRRPCCLCLNVFIMNDLRTGLWILYEKFILYIFARWHTHYILM